MAVARNVAEALSDHVTLEVECVDRLNLYSSLLQTPGGTAYCFHNIRGNPVPFPALMAPITREFVAAIEAFASNHSIDLVRFEEGERKDERAQAYLQDWPSSEGVLYIGKVPEKARVLRTETTISGSQDFGVGRRLGHLEHRTKIGFQTNRHQLSVERLSHTCRLGAERVEQLHAAAEIGGQRAPSLRFDNRRVRALLGALTAFRLLPRGFTHRPLRERVAPLMGTSVEECGASRMTYDLRRLWLRGLIERIPRTRRYRATEEGFRTALCIHRTYARVLRPSLSVVFDTAASRATSSQKAVERFGREIDRPWKGQPTAA